MKSPWTGNLSLLLFYKKVASVFQTIAEQCLNLSVLAKVLFKGYLTINSFFLSLSISVRFLQKSQYCYLYFYNCNWLIDYCNQMSFRFWKVSHYSRAQMVQIEGYSMEKCVPQGFVLSPLLVIIYINTGYIIPNSTFQFFQMTSYAAQHPLLLKPFSLYKLHLM